MRNENFEKAFRRIEGLVVNKIILLDEIAVFQNLKRLLFQMKLLF